MAFLASMADRAEHATKGAASPAACVDVQRIEQDKQS
jgi:hypothetical protein